MKGLYKALEDIVWLTQLGLSMLLPLLLCLGGCALVGLAVYFLLTLVLAVPEARLVVSLARGKGD